MGDEGLPKPGDRHEISRRSALKVIAGSAAGLVVARGAGLPAAWAGPTWRPGPTGALSRLTLGSLRPEITAPKPSLVFQAVRTEDMLYLGFEFYNAHAHVIGGQTYIVPTDKAKPSYMVVVFPSQHLGEQSVKYSTSMTSWPSPPLHGALAGSAGWPSNCPTAPPCPLPWRACLNGPSSNRSWCL